MSTFVDGFLESARRHDLRPIAAAIDYNPTVNADCQSLPTIIATMAAVATEGIQNLSRTCVVKSIKEPVLIIKYQ